MNPSELSAEYANIKSYCRKESGKAFKHPLAPKPAESAQSQPTEGEAAPSEMTDDELETLLREE